ncbi:MAG: YhfC family glutamic-type intramembrane protease [Methanomicrobiaceae archaeon]|nr:YhfC family glutamic-type intramembrane protease [Methanomicrobiaceae archaeon]
MNLLVVATFVVVVLAEILVPLGLGYWLIRRFGASWRIFLLGAAGFVAVQVLHTPLVLLTQGPLVLWLQETVGSQAAVIALLAVYLGLLAGIFEEVGRYLLYRYWFPRKGYARSREHGFLFGAGWGGVESIIVALLVFSSMVSYIVLSALPPELAGIPDDPAALAQVEALLALSPLDILPGLFERMMTITLHIAWSVLVLAAVVTRRHVLLVAAILWHAAVDAAVVYVGHMTGVLAAELALALFAAPAFVYLHREWRRLGQGATFTSPR